MVAELLYSHWWHSLCKADLSFLGAESGHHALLAAAAQPVCCASGALSAAARALPVLQGNMLLLCCLRSACLRLRSVLLVLLGAGRPARHMS